MAKKRGMLAEINRQRRVHAQEQERLQRERHKAHAAAVKKHEQAQRAHEKALAQAAKADAAERKRLEKLAADAHVEAMNAEVEGKNAQLAEAIEELEGLLTATLDVDDYVDLESLKQPVPHAPFSRPDLEPQPLPPVVPPPPQPVYAAPEAPKGMGGLLGKKKYAEEVERAEAAYAEIKSQWDLDVAAHAEKRRETEIQHQQTESNRAMVKKQAHAAYVEECARLDSSAADRCREIDQLIANLGYGVPEAIEEYLSIVVSNSVYPESFDVSHDFEFSAEVAELSIQVTVPDPSILPTIKAYKYTKSTDLISSTDLSQKARKDLYASTIHQVALRTLHEVVEAERRGLIKTITLQVGTESPSPATGAMEFLPFVAVSAERDQFMSFDLSVVQTAASLEHLGA